MDGNNGRGRCDNETSMTYWYSKSWVCNGSSHAGNWASVCSDDPTWVSKPCFYGGVAVSS